jgi:hypothetical protein
MRDIHDRQAMPQGLLAPGGFAFLLGAEFSAATSALVAEVRLFKTPRPKSICFW